MLAETTRALPHGGPIAIDPKVGEIITAHMEGVCADTEEASFASFDRRDTLLRMVTPATLAQLAVIAAALLRLAAE